MAQITVKAKDNFGNHPKHGLITKGASYTIEERDFAPQLFDPPSADYKPIWEREAEAATTAGPAQAVESAPVAEEVKRPARAKDQAASTQEGGK